MILKYSVIVPIYNVEVYLSHCIESILEQPCDNFELLLVDDGSTDNSSVICDEYSRKDVRIKVFHKEHGGVSAARNFGIDNAKGEYITFVDADDWLEPKTITEIIFKGRYDVIRIPCNHNSLNKKYDKDIICNNQQEFYDLLITDFCNACWGRLYKTTVISNTRFDVNIRMGEDILFFIDIIPRINSYHIIPGTIGYHYNKNNQSAQNTLGLMTDMTLLIRGLLKRQKLNRELVWSILQKNCYHNCKCNYKLAVYYESFGLNDIINAPIDVKQKWAFIKSKIQYKLQSKIYKVILINA